MDGGNELVLLNKVSMKFMCIAKHIKISEQVQFFILKNFIKQTQPKIKFKKYYITKIFQNFASICQ